MIIPNRFNVLKLIAAGFFVLLIGSNALSVTSRVSPDHISVNSFYRGSKIEITGEVEAGNEVVIKISSPEAKAHLRKKGKAGGILWMNIGELEFSPVSDVYLLYTTQDLNSILNEEQQDKYGIGYEAFKRLVEIRPVADEAEKVTWIKEFIKFKERDKIYGVFPGKVDTRTTKNRKTYSVTIDWPYQALPQEYTITAYAVEDGVVQDRAENSLVVEQAGALKFLSNMAINNAVIYGIFSIIIAVAAGFLVSLIFKGGSKGH